MSDISRLIDMTVATAIVRAIICHHDCGRLFNANDDVADWVEIRASISIVYNYRIWQDMRLWLDEYCANDWSWRPVVSLDEQSMIVFYIKDVKLAILFKLTWF